MRIFKRNRKALVTGRNVCVRGKDNIARYTSKTIDGMESSSSSYNDVDQRISSTPESIVPQEITDRRRRSSTFSRRRSSVLSADEFTLNKLNSCELGVYGRDEELRRLQRAVDTLQRNRTRDPAMVIIKGYSGTGKSALIHELKVLNQDKDTLFAVGKYDMESRDEPYTALRAALYLIIEQCLNRSNEKDLMGIRAKAKELLGDDWRILLPLCPNLHLLLGETIELGVGEFKDAEENIEGKPWAFRLRYFFQRLIHCLCSPDRPMIIVLDDVQWADTPSIELMDALLSDAYSPPTLLVATCRENEIDLSHPFCSLVGKMKERHLPIEEIALHGLDQSACNRLVCTVLRMEVVEETEQLAQLVRCKTGGNPFFMLQLLQSLIDEEKLTYNFGTTRWHWELNEVQNTMVTDNVASFLAARITKLPSDMKLILQVASCLGQSFQSDHLSNIVVKLASCNILEVALDGAPDGAIEAEIEWLMEVGLFERHDGNKKLNFVHDQVQHAAVQSIPAALKPSIQYQIGKYLLGKCQGPNFNKHDLFLAASSSSCGIDCVTDPRERLSFAEINLCACQHAMRTSAFDAATRFAETGMKFLGELRWHEHYDISLKLGCIAVDAAYCSGDFDKMEHHTNDVLHHGACVEDTLDVYRTRLASLYVQGRSVEGIRDGLRVIKNFGFKPHFSDPSTLSVVFSLLRTKQIMRHHTLESLTSVPFMNDVSRTRAMGVEAWMGLMVYMYNKKLFVVQALRGVVWSLKYGINEYTPRLFAIWGSLCHTVFGDIDTGVMFAEAALQLVDKVDCKTSIPRILYIIYGYIYHWKHDLRASIQPSWYGYIKGMEVGNVDIAMYNLGLYGYLQYETGSRSLDSLLVDAERHTTIMREYNQECVTCFCLCVLQIIYKLVGKDDEPSNLSGTAMQVDSMLGIARETRNATLEVWTASFAMQLAYLFGDYRAARLNADLSKPFGVKIMEGFCMVPRHFFIDALTSVALFREGTPGIRLHRAKMIKNKMRKWQNQGNVNIVHMTNLLDAELAAAKGDKIAAIASYKSSIKIATRNGFLNDAAMAHERTADFYLSCNDKYWASYHASEAIRCYEEWMARAKVEHLRSKYSHLLSDYTTARGM